MTAWTITNGGTTTLVDAELTPTFVIKMNGKTYVTVLVQELTGDAGSNPKVFYEGQYESMETITTRNGIARRINTADERVQSVNVVNITR